MGRRKSNKRAFTVTVEGRPKPKGRPRLGRGGRVFTPKATIEFENHIRDSYLHASGPLYDTPVEVDIVYTRAETEITITPMGEHKTALVADVDNLIKATLDGLQGAAFLNDRLVHRVTAVKQ